MDERMEEPGSFFLFFSFVFSDLVRNTFFSKKKVDFFEQIFIQILTPSADHASLKVMRKQ